MGKAHAGLVAPLLESEELEDLARPFKGRFLASPIRSEQGPKGVRARLQMAAHEHVLEHGELLEEGRRLERPHEAAGRDRVRG